MTTTDGGGERKVQGGARKDGHHRRWLVRIPVPTNLPVWKTNTRARGWEYANCTALKRFGAK